jgi:AcrR family transcriptional regulator
MARLVDETKMERINEAAISLIVERGYGGASISAIAKKAEVADGYLYRFHKSKLDLANQLLYSQISVLIEKMEQLLKASGSIKSVINGFIEALFESAKQNPIDIKYMYVLMHDYTFQISDSQRAVIIEIVQRLLTLGQKTKEIGQDIDEEEMYNICITYPIVFLNQRFKNFFGKSTINESDKQKVIEFALKALK